MNSMSFIVGRQIRVMEVGSANAASVLRLRDGMYYDSASGKFSSSAELFMATHAVCAGVRAISLLPAQQERAEDDLLVHFNDGQFTHLVPVGRATQLDTMERDIRDLWTRKDNAAKGTEAIQERLAEIVNNLSQVREISEELKSKSAVKQGAGVNRGGA